MDRIFLISDLRQQNSRLRKSNDSHNQIFFFFLILILIFNVNGRFKSSNSVYTYCISKVYIYCIIVESGFEVLSFTFTSSRLTKPCSYVYKTVFKNVAV